MMTPMKPIIEKGSEIVDLSETLSENTGGSSISPSTLGSDSLDDIPLAQMSNRPANESAKGKRKTSSRRTSSTNEIHVALDVSSAMSNPKVLKSVKLEKD